MSRSRRKTPIVGNTHAESEKDDKRKANRALRRRVKQEIDSVDDLEALIVPDIDDVSSVWSMDKDGRHYMRNPDPKWMRK